MSIRIDVPRLMLAVLLDGLRTLLRDPSPRRRLEELRWVTSTERSYPFAFEPLCEALGIDPISLRRRLAPWVERSRHEARVKWRNQGGMLRDTFGRARSTRARRRRIPCPGRRPAAERSGSGSER
jgi:hypothetical protein